MSYSYIISFGVWRYSYVALLQAVFCWQSSQILTLYKYYPLRKPVLNITLISSSTIIIIYYY